MLFLRRKLWFAVVWVISFRIVHIIERVDFIIEFSFFIFGFLILRDVLNHLVSRIPALLSSRSILFLDWCSDSAQLVFNREVLDRKRLYGPGSDASSDASPTFNIAEHRLSIATGTILAVSNIRIILNSPWGLRLGTTVALSRHLQGDLSIGFNVLVQPLDLRERVTLGWRRLLERSELIRVLIIALIKHLSWCTTILLHGLHLYHCVVLLLLGTDDLLLGELWESGSNTRLSRSCRLSITILVSLSM